MLHSSFAGDLWSRDCARVQNLEEEIRSLLLQKEKKLLSSSGKKNLGGSSTDGGLSSSGDGGRSSALLRGKLLQFTQELDQLEHSLELQKRENGGQEISSDEWRKRREFLSRMMSQKEQLKHAFDRTHSTYFSDQSNTVEKIHGSTVAKAGIGIGGSGVHTQGGEEGDGAGRLGSKRVLLEKDADVLLSLQDEQLSFLEGTVSNLKNIGYSVGDEVDVHRKLLNELDEEVDLTQTALEKNKKILKQIIDRQSTTCLLLTAIFLAVLLVFLIITTA
ncbi:snare domain-containing protein [Cystoisospora suis]|uniref:Snare domain-containing protein n=1 Tax=Cystoisospora suis TaxID=483139 RepID=A0A2C6KM62_9APIC|nr:snare domain-containing protein [Cystoisospora suis]